jgi:cell division protein FtsX
MIEHNLTLAWRQLVKYRLQSAVSIVSLAIGFACFALASMWIKYETTYDGFHRDADRMYYLMNKGNSTEQLVTDKIEQFPEVEEVTSISYQYAGI